jgi:citrate synthase
MTELKYKPNPVLEKAFDVLFILHADHEQNCSANAMRSVGSSQVDPYSSIAAAAAALYGPLHGGANEAVLRMLMEIGSKDKVPEFIKQVKGGSGRMMGFGHRVYKNYDPRARIIKQVADQVFEVTGRNPLLDIALELDVSPVRRLLHQRKLIQRRFLFGFNLSVDGPADGYVSGAVRNPRTSGGSLSGRDVNRSSKSTSRPRKFIRCYTVTRQ